ncbi:hypothetical protein [Vibrio rotiferianus]|uniref:hypothetical protein n=1 Tax=Vibrio rotiferianus TaxID=190895 RepID=UPI00406A5036
MDNYIEQFVAAFKFLEKFEPELVAMKVDYSNLAKTYRNISEQHVSPSYQNLHKHLLQAAMFSAENFAKQQPIEHQCLSVHFNFQNWLKQKKLGEYTDFKLTIGNVYYKGSNVYETSKAKIKQMVKLGPQLSETLDLHVWLTLDDMTIYDLSIIPTLRAKGYIKGKRESSPEVLVLRPGEESDYEYRRLLVDNGFFHRVDKIRGVYP